MLVVKIIITVIFLFFSFYFLMLAVNSKGKELATVINTIIGVLLAVLTFVMWNQ